MEPPRKKGIIISLNKDTAELHDLVYSLDYQVHKIFIQNREKPDGKYYIGKGLLAQLRDFVIENNIELAIANGVLKPSQWFNMEKELGIQIYDRIRLILDIFADRAQRKEARLQVQLAQYQYERPYVKELIHQARMGEHPGYMSGGEYPVDDYYEMIKKQIRRIKEDLQKIRQDRKTRRRTRRHSGFYLVSITGYANAGKSSLMNALTGEKVIVEEKLFSTLSTTTRRIQKYNGTTLPILLTDTVGFIQDLPHWLIQSFHATLEEISLADVIVLVVDLSENLSTIQEKIRVCLQELQEIGSSATIIMALNKCDLLTVPEITTRIQQLRTTGDMEQYISVPISIKTKKNIEHLVSVIQASLPSPTRIHISLPGDSMHQAFISWLHDKAWIESIHYENDVNLTIGCHPAMASKVINKSSFLGGKTHIL
jgi:GTP-binding protein HflX